MDPHNVYNYYSHDTQSSNLKKHLAHSTPRDLRLLAPSRLDPCLGFAFLLSDHSEYWAWCDEMRFMIGEDQDNAIFGMYETEEDLVQAHGLGRLTSVVKTTLSRMSTLDFK